MNYICFSLRNSRVEIGHYVCGLLACEPPAAMMSGAGAGEMDLDMANSVAENGSNSTSTNAFPLARVKKIIKADKDVNLVSAEAVHLTSMATV